MIEMAFMIAFPVLFLHKITEEGMIFQGIRPLLYNFPEFIKKPLFDCPVCMVPWYGSIILWMGFLYDEWKLPNMFEWFFILVIAGGINSILSPMLEDVDEAKV